MSALARQSRSRPDITALGEDPRPFLLMDLDGVLLPLGTVEDEGGLWPGYRQARLGGFDMQLSETVLAAAPALLSSYRWVWATTWADDMIDGIEDYFGLPALPSLNPGYQTGKLAAGRALLDRHPGARAAWCDDKPLGPGIRAFRREMGERLLLIKPVVRRRQIDHGSHSRLWSSGKGLTPAHLDALFAFAGSC